MEFSEFLSWETLATLGSVVALVVAIVQLLKLPADKVFGKVPTNYVVYGVSLLVMLAVQHFALGGLTIETGIMAAFNAVVVTGLAMISYRQLIERPEEAKAAKSIARARESETPPDEPDGDQDAEPDI